MKVWVFTGTTESGDEVGPYVFSYCPPKATLRAILKRDHPYEFDGDPLNWPDPDYGSVSYHRLEAVEVQNDDS